MRAFFRGLLALWSRQHRAEAYLTELDARMIKDIGLEPWRSPLGAEVARHRELT